MADSSPPQKGILLSTRGRNPSWEPCPVAIFREFNPDSAKFTLHALIARVPDREAFDEEAARWNPLSLVCVAAYRTNYGTAFESDLRSLFPLAAIPERPGWFLWHPRLRTACRKLPFLARRLLTGAAEQDATDSEFGVDLEAREARPIITKRLQP